MVYLFNIILLVGKKMELLENLAETMLKKPFRFEQALKRQTSYYSLKASEQHLSIKEYWWYELQQKKRLVSQDYVFAETDDIIIFTDCWESFSIQPDINKLRSRAMNGYCHYHDFFEIFYVLRGHCLNYINNQEHRLEQGSVCIMNFYAAHERIIPDSNSVILTLCIRKRAFDEHLLNSLYNIPLFRNFFDVNSKFPNSCIYLHDTPNHHLESIFYQLLRAYLFNEETTQSIMKCHILPLFAECARLHFLQGFFSESVFLPENALLDSILKNIETNCGIITLQELAEQYHFSENYLSRFIRKNTGKNFKDLSSLYWKEKAKTLLLCTTLGIDEISELMGTASRSNFERKFKNLVSVSPAQYRQQLYKSRK